MDGIAACLAITAMTIFTSMNSPAEIAIEQSVTSQEAHIDGIKLNGVIYFDAPIHNSATYLR
jgi:hypothetical protein